MPPTIPINHYLDLRNQQNKTVILFHYSMLKYSGSKACFEHSNFLTVKVRNSMHATVKGPHSLPEVRVHPSVLTLRQDEQAHPKIQLRAF